MSQYIRSIIITLAVGSALGSIYSYVADYSLPKSIIVVIVVQVIFFALYNNISALFIRRNIERELTTRIHEYGKQGVEAECAHCTSRNFVPIRFDDDNNFMCEECGGANALYINITTAQKTHPMNVSPLIVTTAEAQTLADTENTIKNKIRNEKS
tara:strand:+ start:307 stop:771 length:465 start_codon:yes stop_codon:yes gene_type:complete